MHVRVLALDTNPQAIQPTSIRALCNMFVSPEDTIALDAVRAARAIGITKFCPACTAEMVERALTSGRALSELSKLASSQGYFQQLVDAARSKPWSKK